MITRHYINKLTMNGKQSHQSQVPLGSADCLHLAILKSFMLTRGQIDIWTCCLHEKSYLITPFITFPAVPWQKRCHFVFEHSFPSLLDLHFLNTSHMQVTGLAKLRRSARVRNDGPGAHGFWTAKSRTRKSIVVEYSYSQRCSHAICSFFNICISWWVSCQSLSTETWDLETCFNVTGNLNFPLQ